MRKCEPENLQVLIMIKLHIYIHHKSLGLHPVPQIKHLMLDFNNFNVQTFYYMDGLIMSLCKCMSNEGKPLCKNWETHIDHNRPSYSNRSTERPTSRASLRNDQETPSWSLSSCLNSFMVVVPVLFLKHHSLSGIETPLQREKPSTTNKYWLGIFTYIYHENQPNVGKYAIHGSYG